jgi:hypothetical protein
VPAPAPSILVNEGEARQFEREARDREEHRQRMAKDSARIAVGAAT